MLWFWTSRANLRACQRKLKKCEGKNENLIQANIGLREGNAEPFPVLTGEVLITDGAWVKSRLRAYGVKLRREPMDSAEYRIPTREYTRAYIKWHYAKYFEGVEFVPDETDCDKFAGKLWGDIRWDTKCNHAGFADDYSGRHAYILYLTPEGELIVEEPQTMEEWEYAEDKMIGIYDAESGWVAL